MPDEHQEHDHAAPVTLADLRKRGTYRKKVSTGEGRRWLAANPEIAASLVQVTDAIKELQRLRNQLAQTNLAPRKRASVTESIRHICSQIDFPKLDAKTARRAAMFEALEMFVGFDFTPPSAVQALPATKEEEAEAVERLRALYEAPFEELPGPPFEVEWFRSVLARVDPPAARSVTDKVIFDAAKAWATRSAGRPVGDGPSCRQLVLVLGKAFGRCFRSLSEIDEFRRKPRAR